MPVTVSVPRHVQSGQYRQRPAPLLPCFVSSIYLTVTERKQKRIVSWSSLVSNQHRADAGIDDDTIESVLTRSGEFWLDVAGKAREKKYSAVEDTDWNTQARFLARRGFPSDLIYRVLGR